MKTDVHEDISVEAFCDGEFAVTIPLHAMLDMSLKQVTAEELAGKLLENEEVRAEIAKTLLRYPSNDMEPSDWREVRESLGQTAIDQLVKDASDRIADVERWNHKLFSYYRDCTQTLEHFERWPDAPKALKSQASGALKRLNETYWGHSEPFKVLGEEWNKVRDHWRTQMIAIITGQVNRDE